MPRQRPARMAASAAVRSLCGTNGGREATRGQSVVGREIVEVEGGRVIVVERRRAGSTRQTLGSVVHQARLTQTLDQEQLGKLVGLTRWQISRIENNHTRPHTNTIVLLAQVLALDYDQLVKLAAQVLA
jgi:DNA-binding XRE family transcriptional regulator